ncbi:unnamed protein product [Ilex paraguariensis]|uniref:Secreted protein n=1 Tax=Ilex paraguariensis TaxID=185542 RepID=A0ABC8U3B6_9AQUA
MLTVVLGLRLGSSGALRFGSAGLQLNFQLVLMVPSSSAKVPASVGTGVSVPPVEVYSPASSSVPSIVSNSLGFPELPGAPAAPLFVEAVDIPGPYEISIKLPPPAALELFELPRVIPNLTGGA